MPLQARPRCWVHFVGVSGGIKTYIGSIMLIKTHPTIYLTIEGGEGVDGGGQLWMSLRNLYILLVTPYHVLYV